MSTVSLIDELMAANKSKKAGKKAAATKRLNAYVAEAVAAGKSETMVRAGIKAAITKRQK